jgi:hypothetical protein
MKNIYVQIRKGSLLFIIALSSVVFSHNLLLQKLYLCYCLYSLFNKIRDKGKIVSAG